MISKFYKHSEHLDELPFTVLGGIPDTCVYIRTGHDQYWRNPDGGWEKTSYYEVVETIEKLNKLANKPLQPTAERGG